MQDITIQIASKSDLESILTLQKIAYISEAKIYNDFMIPPLHQTIVELKVEVEKSVCLKAQKNNKIIGSIRAFEENGVCHIGKLIVDSSHQNNGIGSQLLKEIQLHFPNVNEYNLFTGAKSSKNLHIYKKHGYQITNHKKISDNLTMVILSKINKIA